MTHDELTCPGLDGQNPLGFLAALGLLRVLDDEARRTGGPVPTLRFRDLGYPAACLGGVGDGDAVARAVLEEAERQHDDPLLSLSYDNEGEEVPAPGSGSRRDLKPSPRLAGEVLRRARRSSRASADRAAGAFSELVQDNNGNTKPTAFHFTAGQQEFLRTVGELRGQLSAALVAQALEGPWVSSPEFKSLSWDASVTRMYALRARNPSDEKRGGIPAADWLAMNGLAMLPVLPVRGRLATTGVRGGWKTSRFTWPVWDPGACASVVRSLLGLSVDALDAAQRRALGVWQVYRSSILRADQGGYGSFTPAEVVLPPGGG